MKLIKTKNSEYSIVTDVKKVTIDRLFENDQTCERKIRIETVYGETLNLILYADQKEKLDFRIEPDAPADWLSSEANRKLSRKEKAWLNEKY